MRKSRILWLTVALAAGLSSAVSGAGSEAILRSRVIEEGSAWLAERVTAPHDSVDVALDLPRLSLRGSEVAEVGFDLVSDRPVVGTVPLKVDLTLQDGAVESAIATARVRLYAEVVVAAARIGRHEVISPDGLRKELREVTLATDGYFRSIGELAGLRARRLLAPRRLILVSDVEKVPMIERGSGVTVSVVIGPVQVTSKAKALEDGDLGEMIKIQDVVTGKRLMGTVAGRRLVLLDQSML
jgi:flagella basal body P-ring formation protein FlgA